jgi:GntR family transcriptional regulator
VVTGKLAVGDQLPSVRALAEELVVNPNTVARAYTDLAREGLIESRPGRGVFITRKRKMFTREEGRRRLEPLLEGLIGEAMVMDFTQEELRAAFEKKLSLVMSPELWQSLLLILSIAAQAGWAVFLLLFGGPSCWPF